MEDAMKGFLLSLGAVLAIVVSSTAGPASAANPLKVGVMAPYTGPASRTGEEYKNGANMALHDLRAIGQLPVQIDGAMRDIELFWVDEQSSPEKAVKALQDAVQREGVEIMVNGWHGSVALGIIDIEAQYPMIHFGHLGAPSSISEKIIKNGYRHWFKGMPTSGSMGANYADPITYFVSEGKWKPKSKKIAICVEDTDWGREWGKGFAEGLAAKGWEVVDQDVVKLDETEFTSLLSKYKSKSVSLVAYSLSGSLASSGFVKQFHNSGIDGLLIADGLDWYPDWYQLTGDDSNFTISADSQFTITPEQQEWVDRFTKMFGHEPALSPAGSSYDYIVMLVKGLNKAGTTNFDKLSDTLLNLEHRGIWNYYAFAKKPGDHAIAPYEVKAGAFMEGYMEPMVQHMNGKANVIWPLQYKQADFVAPK
jgi:branched-chain amino acid transport system substrate-binding protein